MRICSLVVVVVVIAGGEAVFEIGAVEAGVRGLTLFHGRNRRKGDVGGDEQIEVGLVVAELRGLREGEEGEDDDGGREVCRESELICFECQILQVCMDQDQSPDSVEMSKCQKVGNKKKKKFNVLNIKSDLTCKDACMNGVTCIASTCPDAAIQLSHTDRHTLSHNSYTRSESGRPETIIVPFFFKPAFF